MNQLAKMHSKQILFQGFKITISQITQLDRSTEMQLVALGRNVAECSALECAQATQIMSCFPLECEEISSLGRGYPTRLRKRDLPTSIGMVTYINLYLKHVPFCYL